MNTVFCEKCGCKLPEQKKRTSQEKEPAPVHIQCPSCGYIRWKNPDPCVSVLVIRDGHVLLGRRTETGTDIMPGKWCLPCGYIEWGESYYDAAKREVLEETGLKIRPVSIVNVVSNHFELAALRKENPEESYESLVVVILAEPDSGEEKAGDDILELGWFPIEGPFPDLAFQADVHTISQYRRFGHQYGILFSQTETVFCERDTF